MSIENILSNVLIIYVLLLALVGAILCFKNKKIRFLVVIWILALVFLFLFSRTEFWITLYLKFNWFRSLQSFGFYASILAIPFISIYFFLKGLIVVGSSIKKKNSFLWLIFLLPFGYLVYDIYRGINPADQFYIDEFERRTSLKLPDNAEVIRKYASYPTIHGDYYSEALIKLDNETYEKLVVELPLNSNEQWCLDSSSRTYLGLQQKVQTCWSKQIETDKYIEVLFFPESFIVYFLYSQT